MRSLRSCVISFVSPSNWQFIESSRLFCFKIDVNRIFMFLALAWVLSQIGILTVAFGWPIVEELVQEPESIQDVSPLSTQDSSDTGFHIASQIDPALRKYQVAHGPTGLVRSVGSDTMVSLMHLWTEKFKSYYRGVRTEVEGQGSAKAMPALIEGTSSFGPMSRPLKFSEIEELEDRFGYKPTVLPVGIDLVGLFVHRDCPLEAISLDQADAIFSSTRRRGHPPIMTWGELGLVGEWAKEPIVLYGRNAASGTYGFFKDQVLNEGDFRPDVLEQPGSSALISAIGGNRFAMGYSGMGGISDGVKALMISERKGATGIRPSHDNALNGTYPLARYLFLTINHKPNSRLDPTRREFLRFVYSQDGQALVVQDGYLPINAIVADDALNDVGIKVEK